MVRFQVALPEVSEEAAQDVLRRVVTVTPVDGDALQCDAPSKMACKTEAIFEVPDDTDVTVKVENIVSDELGHETVRDFEEFEIDAKHLLTPAAEGRVDAHAV